MLKNYLLIQLRIIAKKPILSFFTILGLTLGIAACLLAYLHIQHELSFDSHNDKRAQVYRIVNGDLSSGDGWVKVSTPIPPLLTEQIPEIQNYFRLTRVTYDPKITVQSGVDVFNEANVYMADRAIFDILTLPILEGDASSPLNTPSDILISKEIKQKLFGDEAAIGQPLIVGGIHNFIVTGVFENYQSQSHLNLDYLVSFDNLEKIIPGTSLTGNWGQFNYFAYVELTDGNTSTELMAENKIKSTIISLDENNSMRLEDMNLQPLKDIHFVANRGNEKTAYDKKYLYIYSAVALAILLISVINFINLTVAASTKRISEVGVRKVVGAGRAQLIVQYFSESLLTTVLALVAALVLTNSLLLPWTNAVLDSNIVLNLTDVNLMVTLVGLCVLIALLAGSYISMFITSFSPSQALKGAVKIGGKGNFFKNALLTLQFTISLILILSSLFIYSQLRYIQNKDLGLNTEQIINISLYNQDSREKAGILKTEIERLPFVESVTATRFTAGKANWHQTSWWEGQEEEESMSVIIADQDFVKTLKLNLVEGSHDAIEANNEAYKVKYILNKAAVEHIGWESAVGRQFSIAGDGGKSPILGVVENFNYQSLHEEVAPVVLAYYNSVKPGQLMVRVKSENYQNALAELSNTFSGVVSNTPFEYQFLDEQFASLYEAENRTGKVVGFITIIAIVLALMGVYGLVSFAIQERTKEMAVRKVLGVRLKSIAALLSKGYVTLLLVANIIAIPIVYFVLNNWLNNFSYRIELAPWLFVAGSALVWIFVGITVSLNVYQVTRIDPVKGLRYE